MLRASYARTLETPFNENLIVSSNGCQSAVLSTLIPCVNAPLQPGFRNDFHAGLQQAFGRYVVVSGDYVWKYTHTGYDFSILASTPIFFPIGWQNSKIPGYAVRVSVPEIHGVSALVVFSSVAARFFPPQTSGLGVTVGQSGTPFRIDHDEKFNQTTHLQYQPWKKGPWVGFNWRYDSGLVAGSVPFATDTTTPADLTVLRRPTTAGRVVLREPAPDLSYTPPTCAPSQYGPTLCENTAPGTQDPDHNPQRIAPRSLFDLVGDDLSRGDKYKWVCSQRLLTTNKVVPQLSTIASRLRHAARADGADWVPLLA